MTFKLLDTLRRVDMQGQGMPCPIFRGTAILAVINHGLEARATAILAVINHGLEARAT